MIHEMKLQPEYYHYIFDGSKRIELRLYDEKRKLINIGDTIIFRKEPELEESFRAKVTGLLRYKNFFDLVQDFDISILSDKSMSKDELLDTLDIFYSESLQDKYGVLGIRFEIIYE